MPCINIIIHVCLFAVMGHLVRGLFAAISFGEIGLELGHIFEKCGVYIRSLCDDANEVKTLQNNLAKLKAEYFKQLDLSDHYEDLQNRSYRLLEQLQDEIEMMAINLIRSEVILARQKYKHNLGAWEEFDIDTLLNSSVGIPRAPSEAIQQWTTVGLFALSAGISTGMSIKKHRDLKYVKRKLNGRLDTIFFSYAKLVALVEKEKFYTESDLAYDD